MTERMLRVLRCPRCQSGMRLRSVYISRPSGTVKRTVNHIIFGSVVCNCEEHPVLQGVLYLLPTKKKSLLKMLHQHRYSNSIDEIIGLPRGIARLIKVLKPWGPVDRRLSRFGLGTTPLFSTGVWVLQLMELFPGSRPWAKYLRTRSANPTFFNTIASLSLLRKGLSLDIGSGFGHFIPYLAQKAGNHTVVGIDNSFWNLYFSSLAHPAALHICANIETGIPLQHRSAVNIVMNDCFHCFRNPKMLSVRLLHTLADNGVLCVNHVHNDANQLNFVGKPIRFEKFCHLFRSALVYAVDDETLHRKVVVDNGRIPLSRLYCGRHSYARRIINTARSYSAYVLKHPPLATASLFMPPERYSKTIEYKEDLWRQKQ